MRKLRPSARGQTLIEYALILPVLMLLLVVLFDFGRAVYYYSVVYSAAREGARYGIIHPDDSAGIEDTARNLAVGLDPASLVIASDHQDDGTYNRIAVTIQYVFDPVTPLVEDLLGGSIILSSQSTMNVEE